MIIPRWIPYTEHSRDMGRFAKCAALIRLGCLPNEEDALWLWDTVTLWDTFRYTLPRADYDALWDHCVTAHNKRRWT